MIEDIEVRIGDLVSNHSHEDFSELCFITEYYVNGKLHALTPEQKQFVRKELAKCILANASDLEDILKIYGFDLNTVLLHTNSCMSNPFE